MNIDEHNDNIDRIIAKEMETLGVDVPVSRMMRSVLEKLLRLVAGFAATQMYLLESALKDARHWKDSAQKLSVYNEELIDKIERLEAVK